MSGIHSTPQQSNRLIPFLRSAFPVTIAACVVIVWALIIAEYKVAVDMDNNYEEYYAEDRYRTHPHEPSPESDEHWSSPDLGLGNPEASIFCTRSFALFVDTVHLPLHLVRRLYMKKVRPGVAAGVSLLMMLLWAAQAVVTIVWSVSSYDADDRSRLSETYRLAVANLTFDLFIVLLYLAFMSFSFWLVCSERKRNSTRSGGGDIETK